MAKNSGPSYPSHIPPLSPADEALLEDLAGRSEQAAGAGRRADAERLQAEAVGVRREGERRACLRVADKLDSLVRAGEEPARHAEWRDTAARLRQTADLL